MSRRRNWADPNFNQTIAYNDMLFQFFFNQLQMLAMSRFRWVDLPAKVDARFLELMLVQQGFATISWPENLKPENAFAMQAVLKSAPDANYNYKFWQALGINGVKWDVKAHLNGVVVWDNLLRIPSNNSLIICAREMCDVIRTKQLVRTHMKQPIILKAPREMSQQMNEFTKQLGEGSPFVLTFNGFEQVETVPIQIASGREDMELRELQDDLANTWNVALRFLGINAAPRKMERQTSEEIDQSAEPTDLQALGSLMVRRSACEELNKLTGGKAYVYWNSDIESDAYDFIKNPVVRVESDSDDSEYGQDTSER